ncbi:hypothetical protein F4815DRAFT_468887 [Daldinia loculata]|nr:hypothetical protein F4815DRAFT_468887 [Daldinia loculata]
MPSPNLTTIPLEILLLIVSHLNRRDFTTTRLVCRRLEGSLFRKFAQKYFTMIRFMCTEYSLQALVDISESRLSPYLKHVVVEADLHFEHFGGAREYSNINDVSTEMHVKINKFTQLAADQLAFLNTGRHQQFLIKAFRNLKLERVGVCDLLHDTRCNCASHRAISLGTSQVHRETGAPSRIFHVGRASRWQFLSRTASCVQSVLFALGESRSRPRRLDICAILDGLDDEQAFCIPGFAKDTILPIISGLETIDFGLNPGCPFPHVISPNDGVPVIIDTYYLRTFLSHATHLEALHLREMARDEAFFDWLGASISCNDYEGPPELKPPNTPALTKVHECKLKKCTLPLQSLVLIIRKCSSLRRLTLTNIIFLDHNFDTFCRLFRELFRSSAHLESIHLTNIYIDGDGVAVSFGKSYDHRVRSFSYQGPNMKAELEALQLYIDPEILDFDMDDDMDTEEEEYMYAEEGDTDTGEEEMDG